jgi:hypothetical protein
MTTKCLAKDRNNDNCRNNQLDTSKFCKLHQYMNDYSEKMLDELTICSGCKKMHYLPDSKQCEKCKERGSICRIKHKNEKVFCKKNECNFEKSTDNDYCGKHQKDYFKEETELIGKKVCANYIRGCYSQMNKSDTFSRCIKCREKVRVGNKQENYIINNNLNNLNVLDELDELEKELGFFENKPKKNNIIIVENNKDLEKELGFFENKPKKNNIIIVENNKDLEKELGFFENKPKKNNIIIVENNKDLEKELGINNNKNIEYKSNISVQYKLNTDKKINSLSEHYFIPEYMTDTTKLILEIIDNFENLNIKFPHAEDFMEYDYKINKIIRYVDAIKKDELYIFDNITQCKNPKCKKNMPEHCFIDKYSRKVSNCIICRIHGRIKDNREQRKKSKKEWKEENYDKYALYWQNFRGRKIEELGVEKYLENNAETIEKWRNKNPDKVKLSNEKKKENINTHYKNYIRDANMKNLNFELSFDDFEEIVKQVCYYCGQLQEKGLNGIDKMDYDGGYIKDNCVSCCEMCNIMKGTLTVNVFLKRIEHILTYQGYINGNIFPECFANHINIIFTKYANRANKKNLSFEIDKMYFDVLINKKCYICGKEKSDTHYNGIDRIDNEKGYTKENIAPCCGECNYMKNKYDLNYFIEKLKKIKKKHFEHYNIIKTRFICQDKLDHQKIYNEIKINMTDEELQNLREKNKLKMQKYREKNKNIKLNNDINNKEEILNNDVILENDNCKIQHLNKKTKEQIKEEAKIRKQKQREKLREKYGNEEYKKKRALEIAEYRKNKNIDK